MSSINIQINIQYIKCSIFIQHVRYFHFNLRNFFFFPSRRHLCNCSYLQNFQHSIYVKLHFRIVAYVINIQEEIIYSGEHFTIQFQSVTKRLLNVNLMKENGANSKGCGLMQETAIYSITFSLTGNYLFSTRESRHVSNLTGKCGVVHVRWFHIR